MPNGVLSERRRRSSFSEKASDFCFLISRLSKKQDYSFACLAHEVREHIVMLHVGLKFEQKALVFRIVDGAVVIGARELFNGFERIPKREDQELSAIL